MIKPEDGLENCQKMVKHNPKTMQQCPEMVANYPKTVEHVPNLFKLVQMWQKMFKTVSRIFENCLKVVLKQLGNEPKSDKKGCKTVSKRFKHDLSVNAKYWS